MSGALAGYCGSAWARRFLPAMVLVLACSVQGFGYVIWEDYYFTITDGTAVLRRNGAVLCICDRSQVRIVDNHLLIDGGSAPGIDIVIDGGTTLAIGHEFSRDDRDRSGHHRPPHPPLRPLERPLPPPSEPLSSPAVQVK